MGYDRRQLKEPTKHLYGFGKKRIEPVGVITLSVSFGNPKNPRTEYITFDVVDMHYPYNAIFGRGLFKTFEAALHSLYLCLKVTVMVYNNELVYGRLRDRENDGNTGDARIFRQVQASRMIIALCPVFLYCS
jgi:hypothetical protein